MPRFDRRLQIESCPDGSYRVTPLFSGRPRPTITLPNLPALKDHIWSALETSYGDLIHIQYCPCPVDEDDEDTTT